MTDLILCIADDRTNRHARVSLAAGTLALLDASPSFLAEARDVLASVLAGGRARVERAEGGGIAVSAIAVAADDPRLFDEAARAFRRRGFTAVFLEPRRAEAWRMLRALPLDLDIRDTLTPGLDAVPDADVEELLEMLADAERELAEAIAPPRQ